MFLTLDSLMKTIPLIILSLFFAISAHAQSAVPPATPQSAVEPANTPRAEAEKADAVRKDDDLADTHCLKKTGSRIAPRADKQGRKCVSANGRSYSKEDLDRTGEIDLADALRRLDPAIR